MYPILILLTVPLADPSSATTAVRSTARPEVVRIEVDMLETNIVRTDDGRERFTQIIAWDARTNGTAIDRGYKVVKKGYPAVHRYGDQFRVTWWATPEKVYVLSARQHLATDTDHDREALFRANGGLYRPSW